MENQQRTAENNFEINKYKKKTENDDKKEKFKILNTNKFIEQRPRSTGFKSFLNWFKKVEDLQKTQDEIAYLSDSSETDSSTSSTATVASFAFLPANIYKPFGDATQPEKFIASGPYTETYHRLMLERNRRRNMDKNLSLRKKYSLYASGTIKPGTDEDHNRQIKLYDTFSLPTISKNNANNSELCNRHRKTASLSSKDVIKRNSCHVKGKRRAPPPPHSEYTKSLRKKRHAPPPPAQIDNCLNQSQISSPSHNVTCGPPLITQDKKDMKETPELAYSNKREKNHQEAVQPINNINIELTPKPWYKRQISSYKNKNNVTKQDCSKKKTKHEYPEVGFFRCSKIFDKKNLSPSKNEQDGKNEKRMSCLLPNISELDREAAEIIRHKKEMESQGNNTDYLDGKPSTARDLINKFNALNKPPDSLLKLSPTTSQHHSNVDMNESPKIITTRKVIHNNNENIELHPKIELNVNNDENSKAMWKSEIVVKNINLMHKKEVKNDNQLTSISGSFQSEVFNALPIHCKPTTENSQADVGILEKSNLSEKEEKIKLREILKEMKNSLPKRTKIVVPIDNKLKENDGIKNEIIATGLQKDVSEALETKDKVINKKEPEHKCMEVINIQENSKCDNKLVNIKSSQKPNIVKGEILVSNKVDSSAQTSHMVKKSDNNQSSPCEDHPKQTKKTEPHNTTAANAIYSNLEENLTNVKATQLQKIDNVQILLKKLETAISDGDDLLASNLAKDLAILKINCSVISTPNKKVCQQFQAKKINIFIEDQVSHQGPIPFNIAENMKISELKELINKELQIPEQVQRWIIGKHLTTDDNLPLGHYNGNDFDIPLFLYVVALDKPIKSQVTEIKPNNAKEVKQEVINTDTTPKAVPESSKVSDVESQQKKLTSDDKITVPTKQSKPEQVKPLQLGMKDITKNTWICSACTLINSLLSPLCSACGTHKLNNAYAPQTETKNKQASPKQSKTENHYLQLVTLDNADIVQNVEQFECPICFLNCKKGSGILLRECLHSFCKECIVNTIKFSDEVEIKCPYRDNDYSCDSIIQEREIKSLVDKKLYDQHLAKSITCAENKMKNTFHCKSPNCKGWCIFEDNVNHFRCPVCKKTNCLTCQAIHEGKNCIEYQKQLTEESANTSADGQRTKQMLEEMVTKGEAMICPSCEVLLMKKWGCDWLRCSMCKTEICWVTRGARWGPAGKGDISAGCQCGVNGVKCHPKCNYCH